MTRNHAVSVLNVSSQKLKKIVPAKNLQKVIKAVHVVAVVNSLYWLKDPLQGFFFH